MLLNMNFVYGWSRRAQENIFEKLFDDTGEMLLARACLLAQRKTGSEMLRNL